MPDGPRRPPHAGQIGPSGNWPSAHAFTSAVTRTPSKTDSGPSSCGQAWTLTLRINSTLPAGVMPRCRSPSNKRAFVSSAFSSRVRRVFGGVHPSRWNARLHWSGFSIWRRQFDHLFSLHVVDLVVQFADTGSGHGMTFFLWRMSDPNLFGGFGLSRLFGHRFSPCWDVDAAQLNPV